MITTIKNNSLVDFEHELSLILNSNSNEVEKAKKIIIFIEDILKQITAWLKNHVFESIQEEINEAESKLAQLREMKKAKIEEMKRELEELEK
jgi:anaerobic ribonucleoside-triphosphate reductase